MYMLCIYQFMDLVPEGVECIICVCFMLSSVRLSRVLCACAHTHTHLLHTALREQC